MLWEEPRREIRATSLAGILQSLQPRRENVLCDHQPALARENQALRSDGSDRRVALVTRKQRDGGNQLTQEHEHRAHVERQLLAFHHAQDVGNAPALDAIREQHQRSRRWPFDPPDTRVHRVTHTRQFRDPLADGFGECRSAGQCRHERQLFDHVAGHMVAISEALAESVLKHRPVYRPDRYG